MEALRRFIIAHRKRAKKATILVFRGVIHGAGASTVAKGVTTALNDLNVLRLSAGDVFTEIARKRGKTVLEFSRYLTEHPEEAQRIDQELDTRMLAMIREESGERDAIVADGNVVPFLVALDPLLSPHLCAFLVYADPRIVGERVWRAKRGKDPRFSSPEDAAKAMVERMRNDAQRYLRISDRVDDPLLKKAYRWAGETYLALLEQLDSGEKVNPMPPFCAVLDNSGSVEETLKQLNTYFRRAAPP